MIYIHIYIYTHNGILFRLENEGNPEIYSDVGGPGRHCAKWNKPVIEGQILHESTYWYMGNLK